LAKPEWGTKRTCFSCGARFYDLRREPIMCPICSTVYDPARQPKPKRSGPAVRDEPVLVPIADDEVATEAMDDEAVDEDAGDADLDELEDEGDGSGQGEMEDLGNEEGEIMEDASELGEDDDDIGEVMEHVDDELEDKP
jgi:uncharacterized protein (TIGR02300 family)